ncbi:MAG TPA: glycosyltransferase family A protein [Thermoanaerobaculia bacterium]|jgi:glycosyltransferase involved in cell wall biosynthesis
MPRVTVIIATYNYSAVLPYSIGSVLDQTFADFELLVVGDGCTDDSESVVRGIADPRVRWINIPRAGQQFGPNNEGLRQARGELIAYLGHDDLWLPHRLAIGVAAIDTGADLAHSLVLMVPPHGEPSISKPSDMPPPSCVIHRRAMTEALGGWRDFRELTIAPEGDLWMRARTAGFRFVQVPRLTGVKFSAALRRNVYVDRPSHEQAAWLARIRAEPELEATELAKIAMRWYPHASFARRAWNLATTPSRWRSFVFRGGGARLRREQQFKGVR